MLEALKEEELINKVGGRFKLTTMIQKRMVALNRGARPLVDLPTKDLMEIVVQEILEDKIYLDRSSNVALKGEVAPSVEDLFDDAGPSSDDMG